MFHLLINSLCDYHKSELGGLGPVIFFGMWKPGIFNSQWVFRSARGSASRNEMVGLFTLDEQNRFTRARKGSKSV